MPHHILSREFYLDNPLIVARRLLGKRLVRTYRGQALAGMICETEAYLGEEDSASHAFRGRTPRNEVMYGEAGHAYVYLIYGMHHLLNVTAGAPGIPCAILIRAVLPLEGEAALRKLRKNNKRIADSPGRLCQAFAIGMSCNRWDMTQGKKLWIEDYTEFSDKQITKTPRIGIDYAQPLHRDALWRFVVKV